MKRAIKPQMLPSTKRLVAAIPFLYAPAESICFAASDCIREWVKSVKPPYFESDDLPKLYDIQKNAKEIVSVCLDNINGSDELEAWATEAIKLPPRKVILKSGLRCIDVEYQSNTEYFRSYLVEYIVAAFDDSVIENIKFYIRKCKRCSRIFHKKQVNAEYCGRSCGVMDSRARRVQS